MIYFIKGNGKLSLDLEIKPVCPICNSELIITKAQSHLGIERKRIDSCSDIKCAINFLKPKKFYYSFLTEEENLKIKNIKYSNISESRKRTCSFSKKYWINKGYTEAEAQKKISNIQLLAKTSKDNNIKKDPEKYKDKNPVQKGYWINKGFTEEESIIKSKEHIDKCTRNLPNKKQYWINKGFTEEQAKIKILEFQTGNANKFSKKRKENPEKYNDILENQIGYWIKKGFSEDEAKEKVSDRQAVGRLDRFIERYGEEEGTKRWEERQVKWQNTLNSKDPEELKRINKSKGKKYEYFLEKYGQEYADALFNKKALAGFKGLCSNSGVSKISLELFEQIDIDKMANYGSNEIIVKFGKKLYKPDFYIKYKECEYIIEFFGEYWHCDPRVWNYDDYNKSIKKTAAEVWDIDYNRINKFKELNYNVLVIWEMDFIKNKDKVIKECLNFIQGT